MLSPVGHFVACEAHQMLRPLGAFSLWEMRPAAKELLLFPILMRSVA